MEAVGVDAHVVEVSVAENNVLAEVNNLDHLVLFQVDLDQLGAVRDDTREFGVRRVEHPQVVVGADDHTLHAHELAQR